MVRTWVSSLYEMGATAGILFCFYRFTIINLSVPLSEIDKSSQHKIWKARGNLIKQINILTSLKS